MSKNRNWCFTLNNYTEEEYASIKGIGSKYIVVGKEVGENGTPHLQGYIEFENPRTMKGVKTLLGSRVHLEVRHGSAKQASDYCKKSDSDAYERGTLCNQGERKDLNKIKEDIIGGKPLSDVIMDDFELYARYKNGIDALADQVALKKKRTEMTKGIWLHGPTGVGKSHTAYEMAGSDCYTVPDDNGWWDGYKGQETVVINDFRGGIKYNELLQMIDKWPYSVRRRGKVPMPFTSKTVIITSSLRPQAVYYNIGQTDNINQLLRRLEVIEMKGDSGTEVPPGNTELGVDVDEKILEIEEMLSGGCDPCTSKHAEC